MQGTRQKDICKILYAAYIASMLMQFSLFTIIPGTLIGIVALLAAYGCRKRFSGTAFESHCRWLIRTFWIGGTVWLPVMTVIAAGVIFCMIDLTPIKQAMERGDMLSEIQIAQVIMENNAGLFQWTIWSLTGFFGAWWFLRCGIGLKHLLRGEEIPDVMRWA